MGTFGRKNGPRNLGVASGLKLENEPQRSRLWSRLRLDLDLEVLTVSGRRPECVSRYNPVLETGSATEVE